MHYFNVFSFFLLTSTASFAQDIPLDMSLLEIDQSGANLAVHFSPGVTKDEAATLVEELGYEIVSVDFSGVMVFGESHDLLTESEARKVLSHEKIVDFNQNKLRPPSTPGLGDVSIKYMPGVLVAIRFRGDVSPSVARSIAGKFKEFNVKSVSSSTRDISIKVKEGGEEEAVSKLESLDEIDYVVYLQTDLFPELVEEGDQ